MTSSFHLDFSAQPMRSTVLVGEGLLEKKKSYEQIKKCGKSFALIGDDKALSLFQHYFHDLPIHTFSFPPGEASKSFESYARISEAMVKKGLGRESAIIALGGGVSGDLAGFIAATFCRGIPWIMVPTTLLAMVDSAIGGKTAINLPEGKNLIGAFHPPALVIADLATLKSLPKQERRHGRAEIIKYGLIADPRLLTVQDLRKSVLTSCKIKGEIVTGDLKESGRRSILNFGHTIGHALEKLSGYTLPHGDAVGCGMLFEALISVEKGLLDESAISTLVNFLNKESFPLELPKNVSAHSLIDAMMTDKKRRGKEIRMVLLKAIGKVAHKGKEWTHAVTHEQITRALKTYGRLAH